MQTIKGKCIGIGSEVTETFRGEFKSAVEKKRNLYLRQKELLDTLLEHGAISQAQHDKSLRDLTEKMGMQPSGQPNG